jgi:hypothetical protein
MDNEVRITMPVTSLSNEQVTTIGSAIMSMEQAGINVRTFNTKGDPCEPRMDFKVNLISVCDPETLCAEDCQNLQNCQRENTQN